MEWKKYIFNIDAFVFICLIIFIIYIIYKKGRKTKSIGIPFVKIPKSKKSKKSSSERKKKKKSKLNKHEEECRRIFQNIYRVEFKSVRPKWLKNPATKKNLELDGFNPSIKTPIGKGLAFEYDGRQHSNYIPHFHKNGVKEFEYQVMKDTWKDEKCKEMGVMLIRIPHFVAFHDLERYIRMILRRKWSVTPGNAYKNFTESINIYD